MILSIFSSLSEYVYLGFIGDVEPVFVSIAGVFCIALIAYGVHRSARYVFGERLNDSTWQRRNTTLVTTTYRMPIEFFFGPAMEELLFRGIFIVWFDSLHTWSVWPVGIIASLIYAFMVADSRILDPRLKEFVKHQSPGGTQTELQFSEEDYNLYWIALKHQTLVALGETAILGMTSFVLGVYFQTLWVPFLLHMWWNGARRHFLSLYTPN